MSVFCSLYGERAIGFSVVERSLHTQGKKKAEGGPPSSLLLFDLYFVELFHRKVDFGHMDVLFDRKEIVGVIG